MTRLEAVLKVLGSAHSPVKGYTWNKCYKTQLVRCLHLRFNEDLDLMEDQVFNVDYLMQTEALLQLRAALPLLAKNRQRGAHGQLGPLLEHRGGQYFDLQEHFFSLVAESPQQAAANPGIPRQLCKGKDQR